MCMCAFACACVCLCVCFIESEIQTNLKQWDTPCFASMLESKYF